MNNDSKDIMDVGDSDEKKQDNQDDNDKKDFDIEELFKNEKFQKLFQSELDKRVAQSLKTNDKKWRQKLEEEKRKADMTQEELLAEKEKEIRERELKLEKIQYFKQKDIPLDFLDFVHGNDMDEIEEKANELLKIFNTQVQKAVELRLKDGYIPPKTKDAGKITLEDVKSMTQDEINKNWEVIKELLKTKK